MKVQFEVITYEKDRLDYFTALMKNAQMKYDRLYKRFERSPHLFDGTDALDEAGRKLRFYQDVVAMLEQDYRKQSVGEWVTVGEGITERVVCSNCNSEKGSFMKPPFCNQCGARMKGGAE